MKAKRRTHVHHPNKTLRGWQVQPGFEAGVPSGCRVFWVVTMYVVCSDESMLWRVCVGACCVHTRNMQSNRDGFWLKQMDVVLGVIEFNYRKMEFNPTNISI